jgi:methylmalonyl-CoA mutase
MRRPITTLKPDFDIKPSAFENYNFEKDGLQMRHNMQMMPRL